MLVSRFISGYVVELCLLKIVSNIHEGRVESFSKKFGIMETTLLKHSNRFKLAALLGDLK